MRSCDCNRKVSRRVEAGGVMIKITGPHALADEMLRRIMDMTCADGFVASPVPAGGTRPPGAAS